MQVCGCVGVGDGYRVRDDRAQRSGDLFRRAWGLGKKISADKACQSAGVLTVISRIRQRRADNLSGLRDKPLVSIVTFFGGNQEFGFEQARISYVLRNPRTRATTPPARRIMPAAGGSLSLLSVSTLILASPIFTPVSYTHLRAHETRHDLVCRLLLEK